MSRPQNSFWDFPNPKNSPLEPKKWKMTTKSNVRIEGTLGNKSCSTTWVDPKTVFELFLNPKNSPLGPQKVKNYHKIKSK